MRYLISLLLLGAPWAAAAQTQCNTGPGELYGITGYQCANCSFSREGGRAVYGFNAEPTVVQVKTGSSFQPGDVIESINGNPILTALGAEQFTYPPGREVVVAVRRNGTRLEIATTPSRICSFKTISTGYFTTPHLQFQNALIRTLDSKRFRFATFDDGTGPFGLALACLPSCTRKKSESGEYWQFDSRPPIVALRKGGIAELAGIQVGDEVDEVDGISIVTQKGLLLFNDANKSGRMTLTIVRNGERKVYTLEIRR